MQPASSLPVRICYTKESIVEKISSQTIRYGHRVDAEREARLNPKIRGGARKAKVISDDIFDMHSDLLDLLDERTKMLLNPYSWITHKELHQELVDGNVVGTDICVDESIPM